MVNYARALRFHWQCQQDLVWCSVCSSTMLARCTHVACGHNGLVWSRYVSCHGGRGIPFGVRMHPSPFSLIIMSQLPQTMRKQACSMTSSRSASTDHNLLLKPPTATTMLLRMNALMTTCVQRQKSVKF